jgi:hypothetical protein
MKNTRITGAFSALFLSAALLAFAPAARATTYPNLTYNVTLDLSSLGNDSNTPFSLDLQLVSGSGNATNTVTLSNFVFTGGTASGTSDFTSGNESGSLASTLTLTTGTSPTAQSDNEFAEALSSGVTQVSFSVNQTRNPEVVTSGTAIPDQFNVSVLDSDLDNVPTTDPSGAANDTYTLVSSAITSSETASQVNLYALDVAAAPEPSIYATLLVGLATLGAAIRFRSRHA